MLSELTEFNGAWVHASLDSGLNAFQNGDFSALMGAQAKTADTVPTLYLVGPARLVTDITAYNQHATQARQLILNVEFGKVPKGEQTATLKNAATEIDAGGAAQDKLMQDCRAEIAPDS
jgi:hypothetical protein